MYTFLTCLIPGSTFISRFNFCVRRQIVYTVSYQSLSPYFLFIISNKHKIDFTQGAPCQLPSEHSPLHLPSLLPPPPPTPQCEQCLPFHLPLGGRAAGCYGVGWSPSAVWDAEEWRWASLMQQHHGCAKFQCVWARRRGTWKEQGHFILCGFKRVKLSLWKKERERETKRPLIAYK